MPTPNDLLDKLLPPKGAKANPSKPMTGADRTARLAFYDDPFAWVQSEGVALTALQWSRLLAASRKVSKAHLASDLKHVKTRLDEYVMEYDWPTPDYTLFPPLAPPVVGGVVVVPMMLLAAGGQAWGDPAPEIVSVMPEQLSAAAIQAGGVELWVMGEGLRPPLKADGTPDATGTAVAIPGASIRLVGFGPNTDPLHEFGSTKGECKGFRSIRIGATLPPIVIAPGLYEVRVVNHAEHIIIGGPALEITP